MQMQEPRAQSAHSCTLVHPIPALSRCPTLLHKHGMANNGPISAQAPRTLMSRMRNGSSAATLAATSAWAPTATDHRSASGTTWTAQGTMPAMLPMKSEGSAGTSRRRYSTAHCVRTEKGGSCRLRHRSIRVNQECQSQIHTRTVTSPNKILR
jgi:hypothetical protein